MNRKAFYLLLVALLVFGCSEDNKFEILPDGRVRIDGHFKGAEAKIVFFGVKK